MTHIKESGLQLNPESKNLPPLSICFFDSLSEKYKKTKLSKNALTWLISSTKSSFFVST